MILTPRYRYLPFGELLSQESGIVLIEGHGFAANRNRSLSSKGTENLTTGMCWGICVMAWEASHGRIRESSQKRCGVRLFREARRRGCCGLQFLLQPTMSK
jgi:hypothetical protein